MERPLRFYLPIPLGTWFVFSITQVFNLIRSLPPSGPNGSERRSHCVTPCLRTGWFNPHRATKRPSETLQCPKLSATVRSWLSTRSSCWVHTPQWEWRDDSCVFSLIITPPFIPPDSCHQQFYCKQLLFHYTHILWNSDYFQNLIWSIRLFLISDWSIIQWKSLLSINVISSELPYFQDDLVHFCYTLIKTSVQWL